jgi:uncharacterized coiled-coil protein SlyX
LQTGVLGNSANFDILFRTDNVNRMRLMETGTYNVDGYNIDNSGFLYLGLTPSALTNREAQSVLHIDGTGNNQGLPQTLGFRDWMRPGISFTHNSDRMYVGPKAGEAQDETEAVINWSDNEDSFPGLGPDVLRFLFTGQGGGSTLISGDPLDDQDYDGVEVARMTGDAKMGVGPRWTNDILPKRALDVVHRNKDPQFRLTYEGDDNDIQGGSHADFQVDEEGNTFIKPELNGARAPLVIGFLNDEEDDPYNPTYLDVAGLTRIRNLPSDPNPDCLILGWSLDIVNGAAPEDQFLNRLDFPDVDDPECWGLSGDGTWINFCDQFTDLDWETDGTDVWTGHGQNGYPDGDVTIGDTPGNNARLSIIEVADSPWRSGQYVEVLGTPNALGIMRGILVNTAGPAGNQHIGVDSEARDGKFAIAGRFTTILDTDQSEWCAGTAGYAFGSVEAGHDVIGVYARAENTDPQGAITPLNTRPIGLYAEGINNGGTAGATAASFFGNLQQLTAPITLSDESVKNNIEDIEGGTDLLLQINPKTYNYNFETAFGIAGDTTTAYGFLAQELTETFPEATAVYYTPARYDTSGAILSESAHHLGVKYDYFIPLLVAGFKEQNGFIAEQAQIIEDQEETIEELENQLADLSESLDQLQESVAQLNAVVEQNQAKSTDCCEKISNLIGDAGKLGKQSSLEQNVPNPFQDVTQIDYNLATNGTVRLIITNELGQPIETLVNREMSSGQHSVRWNASNQAPGVYYYTLYFNGDLITKKMIKL